MDKHSGQPQIPSQQGKNYRLDKLEDFADAVYNHGTISLPAILAGRRALNEQTFEAGSLYCPGCGDFRRMRFRLATRPSAQGTIAEKSSTPIVLLNSIYELTCLQCEALFTAVIFSGTNGRPALAMLPRILGGLRTPHTPLSVSFYLDQAYKAQAMNAHSAAMAMYRAALDQLMFQQGYNDKGKMLGAKIKQLEEQLASNKAPPWARDLGPEFLRVLNALGNGSIHPNDGDITKQDTIDADLLGEVQTTFSELLHLVYERDAQRQARLAKLQSRAESLKH